MRKKFGKMIGIFLAAIMCVSVSLSAFAAEDQSANFKWDNMYLGAGGFVTGLAAHPDNADILYARTDVGGMYKYDSGNKSWVQLLDWLNKNERGLFQVRSVALDANNPNIIYAACGNGTLDDILKSEDMGQTWTYMNFKEKTGGGTFCGNGTLARVTGESLAVDPKNSDVIYAGTTGQGVFVTTNGGETWNRIDSIPASSSMNFRSSANNGAVSFVYVANSSVIDGRSSEIYVGSFGNGIYKSSDGGANFELISDNFVGSRNGGTLQLPCRVQKVGTKLYASSYKYDEVPMGGFFVYENGLWTDISPVGELYGAAGFNAFIINDDNPSNILLASAPWSSIHKVWATTDGGHEWTLKGELGDVSALVKDTNADSGVFAAYGAGVRYVKNYDTVFNANTNIKYESRDMGIEEMVCSKLISVPHTDGGSVPEIFVQCWDRGMMVADKFDSDVKATESVPRFHYGGGIDFCEANPLYMFRTGQIGYSETGYATAAVSTDGGISFTDKSWDNWNNAYNNTKDSWTAKNEPDNCTTTQNTDASRIGWNPNLRIVDNAVGATLQDNSEYPILMVHTVGHPNIQNPDINSGYAKGMGSGIYRSTDNGNTWQKTSVNVQRCSSSNFYNTYSLASDRVNGSVFYYLNTVLDYDKTWLEVTYDGGLTWNKYHEGQNDRSLFTGYSSIKSLPYVEGAVWIKGKNGTLYASYDYGVTLNKLDNVSGVEAFGFGKGIKDNIPAAYVIGNVDGVYGMYISTNLGENWIKINPDNQKFTGGAVDICGDRNVCGRVYVSTGGRGAIYGDGKIVTAENADYSPGDTLVLKTTIDNITADEKQITMIAAFYDLNGSLETVYANECTLNPGEYNQNRTFSVVVPEFTKPTVMKAFI